MKLQPGATWFCTRSHLCGFQPQNAARAYKLKVVAGYYDLGSAAACRAPRRVDGSRSTRSDCARRPASASTAGWHLKTIHGIRTAKSKTMLRLRAQVFASIRESFPYDVTFTRPSSRHRYCIAFADVGQVAVVLCRSFNSPEGVWYWLMYVRAATRDLPALVCLLSRDNESIEAYYVMPKIDAVSRMTLTPKDPWFQTGIRLESLTELHSSLVEVKRWVPLETVYRGFSNLYTQLMGRPGRNHVHDEERREAAARTRVRRQI